MSGEKTVDDSTIWSSLPFGTTVSPSVPSAVVNMSYACAGVCLPGAISVTLRPVDTMRGSNTNFLHVKPTAHDSSSLSSISGLNVISTSAARGLQL